MLDAREQQEERNARDEHPAKPFGIAQWQGEEQQNTVADETRIHPTEDLAVSIEFVSLLLLVLGHV